MILSIYLCAYWWFTYLLGRNVYSSPLPIFKLDFLFFIFGLKSCLCILDMSSLSDIWFANIFFYFLNGFFFFFFFKFYFIFKLYITVLVLPNIKMNPPQVYMCSPSWTLLPPPSPFHPSGSSHCTSPKHPVSCIEPGLATHFIHDILHVSMTVSVLVNFMCQLDCAKECPDIWSITILSVLG